MHYVLLVGSFLTYLFHLNHGCTMICAGKNATSDGSVFMAHTDDAGDSASDLRLVYIPAADYPNGTQRPVYNFRNGYPRVVTTSRGKAYARRDNQNLSIPMGYIPQVPHTYAYFDQDYGLMNEKQLMIGESTCGARTVGWSLEQKPHGKNLFNIGELTKIALERCETARCAIQTMGDLSVQYGFYSDDSDTPEDPNYGDSAEALGVADRFGEVWIFHVMTGIDNSSAIWAAARIPDNHISILANGFTIRKLNLTDTNNYMASENVYSAAKQMGWYNESTYENFDFTAVYGFNGDFPFTPLYVGRRTWRVYDVVAPSLHLDSTIGYTSLEETYPFSVKPDTPVNLTTFRNLLSDYFQNTPYDMSQGLAAGPFHMPIRYDGPDHNITGGWERPVSMYRTLFSFILTSKDNHGMIWYGQSSPHGTVYVPFNCHQTALPPSYSEYGKESQFSFDSAFWAFSFVNNWSYLRYSIISPDLLDRRETLQNEAYTFERKIQNKLEGKEWKSEAKMQKYMNHKYNDFAKYIVKEWWKLAFQLVSKYSDGFRTIGEGDNQMEAPGYPKWFLEHTEFGQWPGNTYEPDENSTHTTPTLNVMNTTDLDSSEDLPVITNITKNATAVYETLRKSSVQLEEVPSLAISAYHIFYLGGLVFIAFMILGFLYGSYLARQRHGYSRIQ